jgi:transposase
MIIIPDIPNIVIEDVSVANEITLTVRTTSPTACCSSCGATSERVQSRYMRTLHDLPASGRPVTLLVQVRRFFCPQRSCPRKIFAEPLPELCRPHAQRTLRLQKALSQLGLTVGGQAGAECSAVIRFGLLMEQDQASKPFHRRPQGKSRRAERDQNKSLPQMPSLRSQHRHPQN